MEIIEKLDLKAERDQYTITVGRGLLPHAADFFSLSRRVLIVTDSGVPIEYAKAIEACCAEAKILVIPMGEENKNINTLEKILTVMHDFGLNRSSAAVAVGGGVVGDMTGFAAAIYMRGIDFYNVPTTLLSQLDSSIGGKTAIDFCGAKNIIGAFHQPKGVLIDIDTLSTLEPRQVSAGLAEAVKMAICRDKSLFELIESCDITERLSDIIIGSLKIKRAVVMADEREAGERKILNFGHTFGHGIEALGGLYHGECVALGMLPMTSAEARERLIKVLKKCALPTSGGFSVDEALAFMRHDKKGAGNAVDAVFVERIGECTIRRIPYAELDAIIKGYKFENKIFK